MQTITCPQCHTSIEISKVLTEEIERTLLAAEKAKWDKQSEEEKKRLTDALSAQIKQQYITTEEALKQKESLLEKRIGELTDLLMQEKKRTIEMELREKEQELKIADIVAKERQKVFEEASKIEFERQSLKIAEKDKQLDDLKKALALAQQKSDQVSQQLQGEVLELQLEQMLKQAFPTDIIQPVGKGVHGADITQEIRTPKGTACGMLLWESKRTKRWDEKWIDKLREDMRIAGAMGAVIVSAELPPDCVAGIASRSGGIWIVKEVLAVSLAQLLRDKLIAVARERFIAANKTEKAEMLYTYVTSHEFQQQVASLMEVYRDMKEQIVRERSAFEKVWKQRESQADKLLSGTSGIIGRMDGYGARLQSNSLFEITED
jgi:hypothetical protein